MVYVLSFGLIMMGYICHFYISLYAEELRKQTKIMTDLVEFIETPFSEDESKELSGGYESESESDELSEEDSEPSEEESEPEEDPDEPSEESESDDYDLDEPDKIMKEHTDDIREIINHIFSSMNMGLNQT
jgi:hypothetical protein